MAAEAGDGRSHSEAVAGNACLAFDELRPLGERTAGHGHFCRILAAPRAIEGGEEAEMDSLNGGRRGAIDVPRAAGFRNHGDKPYRDFFRADGGAHRRLTAGAGAEFSGLRARTGPRTMGAAGNLGPAPAFDGVERKSVADCRLWIDRQGSGEAS